MNIGVTGNAFECLITRTMQCVVTVVDADVQRIRCTPCSKLYRPERVFANMCRKFFKDMYQEYRVKEFCKQLDDLTLKFGMHIKEPFTLIDVVNKEVVGEDMEADYEFSLAWYKWKKEREANR